MEDLGEDALEWLHSPGEDARLEARQAAELLEVAMRELSPEDRQVITLLELEGWSVREICRLTGSSNAAVRVRAFRARAKLKKTLSRMSNAGEKK